MLDIENRENFILPFVKCKTVAVTNWKPIAFPASLYSRVAYLSCFWYLDLIHQEGFSISAFVVTRLAMGIINWKDPSMKIKNQAQHGDLMPLYVAFIVLLL